MGFYYRNLYESSAASSHLIHKTSWLEAQKDVNVCPQPSWEQALDVALDVASMVYSSTEVREPLAKRTQLRATEVQAAAWKPQQLTFFPETFCAIWAFTVMQTA